MNFVAQFDRLTDYLSLYFGTLRHRGQLKAFIDMVIWHDMAVLCHIKLEHIFSYSINAQFIIWLFLVIAVYNYVFQCRSKSILLNMYYLILFILRIFSKQLAIIRALLSFGTSVLKRHICESPHVFHNYFHTNIYSKINK